MSVSDNGVGLTGSTSIWMTAYRSRQRTRTAGGRIGARTSRLGQTASPLNPSLFYSICRKLRKILHTFWGGNLGRLRQDGQGTGGSPVPRQNTSARAANIKVVWVGWLCERASPATSSGEMRRIERPST